MGTAIPEASRAILKQWQAMGLRFDWCGHGDFDLDFDGSDSSKYVILEQPIPGGVTVDQVQAMWEKGLKVGLNFDVETWCHVSDTFNWEGEPFGVGGAQLLARLRLPAQPIPEGLLPEGLLQEPATELPAEECVIGNEPKWEAPKPMAFTLSLESDPGGLDPHAPGAKLDAGKNRLGLVLGGFAKALEEVGKVGTYGANKYSDNGWKKVEKGAARYDDAMLRHWLAQKKDWVDAETGLLHQAQVVWNALAVLELMLMEEE